MARTMIEQYVKDAHCDSIAYMPTKDAIWESELDRIILTAKLRSILQIELRGYVDVSPVRVFERLN